MSVSTKTLWSVLCLLLLWFMPMSEAILHWRYNFFFFKEYSEKMLLNVNGNTIWAELSNTFVRGKIYVLKLNNLYTVQWSKMACQYWSGRLKGNLHFKVIFSQLIFFCFFSIFFLKFLHSYEDFLHNFIISFFYNRSV